jgi:hypothetical protein
LLQYFCDGSAVTDGNVAIDHKSRVQKVILKKEKEKEKEKVNYIFLVNIKSHLSDVYSPRMDMASETLIVYMVY